MRRVEENYNKSRADKNKKTKSGIYGKKKQRKTFQNQHLGRLKHFSLKKYKFPD